MTIAHNESELSSILASFPRVFTRELHLTVQNLSKAPIINLEDAVEVVGSDVFPLISHSGASAFSWPDSTDL